MSSTRGACLFPGQGSQRKGMGADLFERFATLCSAADEILGYSIQELCLVDSQRRLRKTAFTQPALFVVNALTWLHRLESEPLPGFVAGHSLGEYNALFAAGCFDFETGLRLVQHRGAIMGRVEDGGMAAVLGLRAERVTEILEDRGAPVDIANFNLASQLVLSGPKEELENLIQPLDAAGARKCVILNVSGAFHSRYMASAAAELESFLEGLRFTPPRIEVIANTTARPYTADSIARHLADQVRSPVRWSQTMDYLRAQGVTEIEELGPGKVLQKMWAAAWEESSSATETALSGVPSEGTASAAEQLGDSAFREQLGLRYAYVATAPAPEISTPELVIGLGKRGCLGFLDFDSEATRGDTASDAIRDVARALGPGGSFGVILRPTAWDAPHQPENSEERLVAIALGEGVRVAEAVGYHRITPALVRFRFKGSYRKASGAAIAPRHLLAQVSRATAAALFLAPAPESIVASLVARGELTADEGEIARQLPIASDLCAVPEPAEGTDLATLLPSILRLRDQAEAGSAQRIRVGAGGALGTPEAIACAFLIGADFIQTSAINMACVEAATPPPIKHLLARLTSGETTTDPAADGFMLGARTRVVQKGSLFSARARKLYQLFRFCDSLEAIDPILREKLEATCFKRSLSAILDSLGADGTTNGHDPKHQMALVFSWYLRRSLRWALDDHREEKLNHQIPCDESVAAFNLYAADTPLADPDRRTAASIAETLMHDAAVFLSGRTRALRKESP